MIGRRRLLAGAAATLVMRPPAEAQGPWPHWLGAYVGALQFYRSIPLEDIYPPPSNPRLDHDDRTPFGAQFDIRAVGSEGVIWLRLDGGPMLTAERGETLRFGPLIDAVPAPRSATLTLRADLFSTEALFSHADGSFWRRHFTARFTPAGVDLIVWVFDAAGTRARTWRGTATRRH
jgi:hypothetical protein